jgi:hypothetical protein
MKRSFGVQLYINRRVRWHNHLDVIEVRDETILKVFRFPTLSYFVTAQDRGHPIQLTPSSSHVGSKCDSDTLKVPRLVRIKIFLARVNLRVYLAPIQVIPAGPSRGAMVLLSIQPVISKDSKREPRLAVQMSQIV